MFAVELFVLLFCAICCFFYTPVKGQPTENEMAEETPINSSQSTEIVDYSGDIQTLPIENLEEVIANLNIVQIRKVAFLLREKHLISQEVKLSGKGVKKQYLVTLISDRVSQYGETIAEMISQVKGQVVAQ
jgi:hypothetical protein